MKKTLLLIFTVVLICLLTVLVSAGSDTHPDGAIWHVRASDGTESYSYDYFDGLKNAKNGDHLTLIPDYIELDMIFTLDSGREFSIDIGDSVIVYPNNTYEEPVFNIRSGTSLTVYADGAELYLQNNVRSYISISGTSKLFIYGGEKGFYSSAPDVVDAGDTAYVELHNVHFMKNSGNMMGLVCSRASSTVKIFDSTLVTDNGANNLYVCVNGRAELYNSVVISLSGANGIQVTDDGAGNVASLYVYDSIIAADVKNTGKISVGGVSYLKSSTNVTAMDGHSIFKSTMDATLNASRFVAPASHTLETVKATLTAYTLPDVGNETTDTVAENSVWMVKNGDSVYYTPSFYYPLINSKEGDCLTLLSDVELAYCLDTVILAKSIDLGNYSLTVDLPDFIDGTSKRLFNTSGSSEISIIANGRITSDVMLLYTTCPVFVTVGNEIAAPSFVVSYGAAVTVLGGRINSTATAITTVGNADVNLNGVTVVSGSAMNVGASLFAIDSRIVNTTGGEAVVANRTVNLSQNTLVYGTLSAADISADNAVYFNTPPTHFSDFLVKRLADPYVHPDIPDYSFGYRASKLDGEIRASFDVSGDVILNIYVPSYVYDYSDTFTVLSVDGIVYNPQAHDNFTVIDGDEYTVFRYSQVHASDITEKGSVRISVAEYEYECSFTLLDLFERSIVAAADDDVKTLFAAYLDYAFDVTGYVPNDELYALVHQYAVTTAVPTPDAPDFIRSVYFDPEREVITILPADGISFASARIDWNGRTLTVNAQDGVITIPYLRLDPSVEISVFYRLDGTTHTERIGILSLYATIKDSPGNSARLFLKYLGYLTVYKSLV